MKYSLPKVWPFTIFLAFIGCAHQPVRTSLMPHVDIPRFMGDWHVISSIPLASEKDAYSAVESYRLKEDGRIQTTYTFNEGSLEGPLKTYRPVGTVYDPTTNAEWRMQFIWPFKGVYLIHYVDDAYATTIVGGSNHSHVWVMARAPHISDALYQSLVARAADFGYDVTKLRRVPQK
jgi:apolipoprotein D and lipocalin family protein